MQIKLQDQVLGQRPLQRQREVDLPQLAAVLARRSRFEQPRDLHRQGGAARVHPAIEDRLHARPRQCPRIDARMLAKALVLVRKQHTHIQRIGTVRRRGKPPSTIGHGMGPQKRAVAVQHLDDISKASGGRTVASIHWSSQSRPGATSQSPRASVMIQCAGMVMPPAPGLTRDPRRGAGDHPLQAGAPVQIWSGCGATGPPPFAPHSADGNRAANGSRGGLSRWRYDQCPGLAPGPIGGAVHVLEQRGGMMKGTGADGTDDKGQAKGLVR